MGESIMIVDDDDAVLGTMCRYAESMGYTVTGASSGEQALDTLEQSPVDALITDIQMPGMDGLSLAKRLLEQDPDRPVLLVTGYADVDTARRAVHIGVYEYFVKPIEFNDLFAGVHRALENRRLVLENKVYQKELEQKVAGRTAKLRAANEQLQQEIAERKQAEEARKATERELGRQRALSMHSDRLRSLGEMATGIAHELNQPLSGILILVEHLLVGMDRGWDFTDDEVRSKLKLIVEQIDRMTHIIQHIRMFAREANSPKVEFVQVNDVVQASTRMLGEQFRARGVDLTCELAEDLPQVLANPFSLEETVLNLLINARDAVEEGMEAGVPLESSPILVRTQMGCEGSERLVRIEVIDRGVGIPDAVLPNVFDPFFTTKEPDRGTGLGLTISRSIVEGFGGAVQIESTAGEGTTAAIALPVKTKSE